MRRIPRRPCSPSSSPKSVTLCARVPGTSQGWHAHLSRRSARPVRDVPVAVDRSEPRRTAGAVRTNRRSARPLRADRRPESHRHRGPAVDREAATPHGTNGGSRGRIPRGPSRASLGRRRAHRSWRGADEERRLGGSARGPARHGTGCRREFRPVRRARPRLPACRRRPPRPRVLQAGDGARAWRSGPGRRVRSHAASVRLIDHGRRNRRGRGERRAVRLADRIRPRPAAAGDRGPRARAEPEWIVGHARRRRRHLASQSLDQPGSFAAREARATSRCRTAT